MKKSLITIILFMALILIIPLASAENETAECSMTFTDDYCPPTCSTDDDSDCCEQAEKCVVDNECTNCVEMTCEDSDGGKDYYTAGSHSSCTPDGICHYPILCDRCLDDTTLIECYCEGSESKNEEYVCPTGCSGGACIKAEEPKTCAARIEINFDKTNYVAGEQFESKMGVFDSQGNPLSDYVFYTKMYDDRWHTPGQERTGADGYVTRKGTIENLPDGITKAIFNVYTEKTEFCGVVEDTTEIEVEPGSEPPPRPEPDPEPRPETCAARISASFDKNVYYVGDEFKVVMETFDAQGNHLPHYSFNIQAYDYESGVWKEIGQDRTDGEGYRIHQDKIKIGEPFRFGKNKFKIFTTVSGCDLVEWVTIIEIKIKEAEPVPCGMGSCVPDDGLINISDGRSFYSCNGCEVNEKCYPIGYRKSGEYCTPDNEFVNQIEKGVCDNHFECESNLCISGECVGEGLIKKIMNWLKKMFGDEEEDGIEKACSKLLIEKNIGDYRYEKSVYGVDEHTQAPLFSEDGEHLDTIKCCAALYKDTEDTEHGVLFCPYDSKEDVTNSVKWIIAKERNIVFKEYENEKVFGDDKGQIVAWTNNGYLIAVGVGPTEKNIPLPDDIANAYLKKYPSEFELTEDDIPDAPPDKPWVYCTEEDEKKGDECQASGGGLQTDPNPENKSCEIYVGCILPYEKCESKTDIKEREDCYVGVAEMTGDSSVCKEITSDESRKNKCYVKAAETSKDIGICEKITEDNIKRMCLELLKDVVPWVTCKSDEDMLKEECHFTDDFENGLGNWVFSSAGAGSEVVENGNTVMRLVGVERANVHRVWDNYFFKFRFKMIDGSVHVDFRRSEGYTDGARRYLVGMNYVGVYNLNKQIGRDWRKLEEVDFRLDDGWHTLEIRGYEDIINVYVDDELIIKHKDTINTFYSGWVRFEAHNGGVPGLIPELLIDDVEIRLITEDEIVYP